MESDEGGELMARAERRRYACPNCGDRLYPAGDGVLGCLYCLLLFRPKRKISAKAAVMNLKAK